jgi:hypothetical protein
MSPACRFIIIGTFVYIVKCSVKRTAAGMKTMEEKSYKRRQVE